MYELGIAHPVDKKTILYQLNSAHIRRIESEDNAIGGNKLENMTFLKH